MMKEEIGFKWQVISRLKEGKNTHSLSQLYLMEAMGPKDPGQAFCTQW